MCKNHEKINFRVVWVYPTPLMYYVYILQSKLKNQLYFGSTNNLKKRFQDHNDGKVVFTRRYRPWKLLYY